jgi:5-methylcytosine-specific restriction enzyme subunit McrC
VRFENFEKFHAANLYQLYAYLRTQEHRGPAYRDANGVLLYPVTNRSLDERMKVQGHEMRIRTVDLALPWMELERDLLRLVE